MNRPFGRSRTAAGGSLDFRQSLGAASPRGSRRWPRRREGGPAWRRRAPRRMEARFSSFRARVAVLYSRHRPRRQCAGAIVVAKPGGMSFAHAEPTSRRQEVQPIPGRDEGVRACRRRREEQPPDACQAALDAVPDGATHRGRPRSSAITNMTEAGTVYARPDIEATSRCEVAGRRRSPRRARLATALASLDASPGNLTARGRRHPCRWRPQERLHRRPCGGAVDPLRAATPL